MSGRPLSFAWPRRARVPLALIGFLLLSLLAHLITFYLFQVEYPPSVTIAPPPARITILRPDSPANISFMRWIDASDPALNSRPPEVTPPPTDLSDFVPSYSGRSNAPIIPAPSVEAPARNYPEAIDGLALVEHVGTPGRTVAPVARETARTKVVLSTELRGRLGDALPEVDFAGASAKSPVPSRFLIGTSDESGKPLIFLQTSAGDDALDARAEAFLKSLSFSSGPTVWGFATFHWGTEVWNAKTP